MKIQRKIAMERRIFFIVLIGGCFFAAFFKNIHTPIIGATTIITCPDIRTICSIRVGCGGGEGSPITTCGLYWNSSDGPKNFPCSDCPNTFTMLVTMYPMTSPRRVFIFFIGCWWGKTEQCLIIVIFLGNANTLALEFPGESPMIMLFILFDDECHFFYVILHLLTLLPSFFDELINGRRFNKSGELVKKRCFFFVR